MLYKSEIERTPWSLRGVRVFDAVSRGATGSHEA